MTLTIGKRFQFPVANRNKIAYAALRRLIGYGYYFVIVDIEICLKNGKIDHGNDTIIIMASLGDEQTWEFKRNEIEDLLYEGKT